MPRIEQRKLVTEMKKRPRLSFPLFFGQLSLTSVPALIGGPAVAALFLVKFGDTFASTERESALPRHAAKKRKKQLTLYGRPLNDHWNRRGPRYQGTGTGRHRLVGAG
jgi:hypothetical protein